VLVVLLGGAAIGRGDGPGPSFQDLEESLLAPYAAMSKRT